MKQLYWSRWLLILGVALVCSATIAALPASPLTPVQGKKGKKGEIRGEFQTVQGIVSSFTTAPKGEMDGLILNDGTWVHWPPHLADQFTGIAVKGDKVKVIGQQRTGPKGDNKLEASTITNLRTGKSRQNQDLPPPAEQITAKEGEFQTTQGIVRQFTTAPKGERDGVILSDGTWAHWPPHMATRFTNIVDKGDRVKVVGQWKTGKKGDTKLEVSTLTNLHTGQSRQNDDLPAPKLAPTLPGSTEQRLQALEDRLMELLQELRAIRAKK